MKHGSLYALRICFFPPHSICPKSAFLQRPLKLRSYSVSTISNSAEVKTIAMASSLPGGSSQFALPKVPVPHCNFLSYVGKGESEHIPGLVAPYNQFEAKLREGYAQHRDEPALQDPNINAVPIFQDGQGLPHIRARPLSDEARNASYVMPLKKEDRRPDGSPATVESLQQFKKNFNLFSESSLVDLDWKNVVAAGSSVVTSLLPVPEKQSTSKKVLR